MSDRLNDILNVPVMNLGFAELDIESDNNNILVMLHQNLVGQVF